ncbi:chemotaxis protein CheW [Azospirillum sp.]|uniref:chemotaxis protein CheW n=1 Tax=Azospirillum sp. TaxID=34012 RepID=UPI002D38A312|nr:chemotaxis protein CheW [Azospirillum sp.]HYF88404.1 chemotaxis protein CheW [Azospirillum sp.]
MANPIDVGADGSAPSAAPGADAARGDIQADGQADNRQFVTFTVRSETFAVPLAEVQEIIRLPDMVQVPMSPRSLEGLANLRGTVLPVASLRRMFQVEDAEHDDATRVVVINRGVPVGFIVDRMASVVSVEPADIETVDGIRSTVAADLLAGMIKHGSAMIQILDPARLIEQEFRGFGARRTSAAELDSMREGGAAQDREAVDEVQLVSFEVAGQEYALPIEDVQEIVQVPASISHIPNSDSHVVGVMTLRRRLLPLVSLRRMFGLPATGLDEHNRIVVVSLGTDAEGGESGGGSVGVVTDTVKEVLRVNRSLVDSMPALLNRGGAKGEIQSICRLKDGQRLVSILTADRMFRNADLSEAVAAQGDGGEISMDSSNTRPGAVDDEEQFVVFRLAQEEYGVPIDSVQEIVRVPDELTHVPKTPDFIEGVVNLRGTVLPVIDQRRRFGLPETARNDRQRIMVFTINGVRTGFIVDSVSEVLKIARSVIGRAPELSAEQSSLITRVANIERQKRIILLLDVDQLLDKKELGALVQAA